MAAKENPGRTEDIERLRKLAGQTASPPVKVLLEITLRLAEDFDDLEERLLRIERNQQAE